MSEKEKEGKEKERKVFIGFVFTCGRRPTGHGKIPVAVVVVVGGNNF